VGYYDGAGGVHCLPTRKQRRFLRCLGPPAAQASPIPGKQSNHLRVRAIRPALRLVRSPLPCNRSAHWDAAWLAFLYCARQRLQTRQRTFRCTCDPCVPENAGRIRPLFCAHTFLAARLVAVHGMAVLTARTLHGLTRCRNLGNPLMLNCKHYWLTSVTVSTRSCSIMQPPVMWHMRSGGSLVRVDCCTTVVVQCGCGQQFRYFCEGGTSGLSQPPVSMASTRSCAMRLYEARSGNAALGRAAELQSTAKLPPGTVSVRLEQTCW
jgi:hypothetical protein